MSGELKIYNGICICLARLALTDGYGKWEPGTVLELYPLGFHLEWGDKAKFLIMKTVLTESQIHSAKQRKLRIPLDSFLSDLSIWGYRANISMKKGVFIAAGLEPKLDKQVDGKVLGEPTPEWQWVKPGEPIDISETIKNKKRTV